MGRVLSVDSRKMKMMSQVTGWLNVQRAGNVALQQPAFLAGTVNAGPARDSRDSLQAQAQGIRPGVLGVYCHTRCNPHYDLSRAGAFLHSVQWEGPYEKKLDERRWGGYVALQRSNEDVCWLTRCVSELNASPRPGLHGPRAESGAMHVV
jgi:hypothetical protein